MRSKYEIHVSRTANIELISKLDSEYTKYIASAPKDGQKLNAKLLEARVNEIRFLKQNAYANLLGFTMKLETIERLHKSKNPMFAMELYSKYCNYFESTDGDDIKLKKIPYIFALKMLGVSAIFYFISFVGSAFVILDENPIFNSLTFGTITVLSLIAATMIFIKGLDYLTTTKSYLQKNVLDT